MTSPKDVLSADMYYKAIEGSDSALWVLDMATSYCYLSNRYFTMLGYSPQEFDGTMENLFNLLHPDDVQKTKIIFDDFFNNRIPTYRNEVRLKSKSGAFLHVLTQGAAERNDQGVMTKFIGWNIDITPLKEVQRKLDEERIYNISQSRLAQIGLFSGGISHEINNPLTVIHLRSQNLLKALRSGQSVDQETLIKSLEHIFEAGKRIGNITQSLQTIAGNGVTQQRSTLSLKAIVEEVISVIKPALGEEISLVTDLAESQADIFANSALLTQVLMNILKNAVDAVESVENKKIFIKCWSDTSFSYLSFADNGVGIHPQDMDKVMLPFFTTKGPGKGSGLGLSIAQSIVNSQNGEIYFSSVPGLTTFTVRMPLSKSFIP